MLWFWVSVFAASLWGLSYALVENILKSNISSFSLMAVYTWVAMPIFTILAWHDKSLVSGLAILKANPKMIGTIFIVVLCYFFGNALIYWAIKHNNATSVSFIEISYPFFVALFSMILFQQNHLSLGTILGGVLIFGGVTTIYVFK